MRVMTMGKSANFLTTLVAVSLILASSAARAEVWVVDGSVRVDPVSGELIEERHPSSDGVDASYHDLNPVWNREEGEISLLAGRNEVVAFQVIVDGGPHTGVALEVSDLVGPETLSSSDHVRRYREWFLNVVRESEFCEDTNLVTSLGLGWYPDALIPLDVPVDEGFGQPFAVPDERNGIPDQTATAFWVDVLIPEGAQPGWYQAVVRVDFDSDTVEIPLFVEVRDFSLSSYNHAGLGSVNYGGLSFEILQGAGGAEGLIPWFQESHAHRLEVDALWLWPPWVDGVSVDWDAFREIWRPFMTGDAFTSEAGYWGPSEGEPIRRFVLPNECNWPVWFDSWANPWTNDPAFWQQALVDVEAILIDEGWTDIEAHLFLNGLDEPRTEEIFAMVQAYGDLVDTAGLVDRRNILFRLDAGMFKAIGNLLPGWDLDRIFDEIGGTVDVWNENGGVDYIAADATLERLEENPDEMWWFYNTCSAGEPATGSIALEAEALSMRTWGWIVYRYRLQGAVTWEMDGMMHDINALGCWTNPQCSGYRINGDTVVFYLGEFVGLDGRPVPSIRLKNMRRGSQDHEYLRLLAEHEGSTERSHEIAGAIIPNALDDGLVHDGSTGRWAHDPRAYENVRREIADVLSDPLGPHPDGGPGDSGPGDSGPGDGGSDDSGPDGGGGDGGPDGGDGDESGCSCRATASRPSLGSILGPILRFAGR